MIGSIISQYLAQNRRLIIPQLGAFLVKEPDHTVVFSPLLTRDDGVLLSLLIESGMSEIEASGAIYRVIFDIRYIIENGGEYLLKGVGRFTRSADSKLIFEANPMAGIEVAEEVTAVAPADETAEAAPVTPTAPERNILIEELQHPTPRHEKPEQPAENLLEPDPDLDGLSYGASKRTTRRSTAPSSYPAPRKLDWWMIIGIIAAAAAVSAIAYGFFREGAAPLF